MNGRIVIVGMWSAIIGVGRSDLVAVVLVLKSDGGGCAGDFPSAGVVFAFLWISIADCTTSLS